MTITAMTTASKQVVVLDRSAELEAEERLVLRKIEAVDAERIDAGERLAAVW